MREKVNQLTDCPRPGPQHSLKQLLPSMPSYHHHTASLKEPRQDAALSGQLSVLFLSVPNHCFSSSGVQAGTGGKLVPASMKRTTQPPSQQRLRRACYLPQCSCTCCQGVTAPQDVCLKLIWEVAHAVHDGKWSTRGKGENKKRSK